MEQLIGHDVRPVCRDDGECDLSHGRVVHVSQPGCCGYPESQARQRTSYGQLQELPAQRGDAESGRSSSW